MPKITAKTESFALDYRQESLPELFVQRATNASFSNVEGVLELWDTARFVSVLQQVQNTLFFAVERIANTEAIKILKELADKGVRVYLLLGGETENKDAIDVLSGRCLIRTGVIQEGAFVLLDNANPHSRGLFLLSSTFLSKPQSSSFVVELEKIQREDANRSFSKLFWEYASHDYKEQGKQRNKKTYKKRKHEQ